MTSASIEISELTAQDHDRWDAFVEACPRATFCHRAGWQTVIERAFGHRTRFLMATRDGRIEGVLPLARVRSLLFGDQLVSLPFCVYGGIAADTGEAAIALDAAAQAYAAECGVDHLEYRNMEPRHDDWPTKELYVTFRKAIEPDVDANMQAIPRKQRRMVRQGMKAGLTSAFDDDVDRFFRIYAQNVHRMGTPVFSKRYFQTLLDVFGDACRILAVHRGDEPVASVMTFYFRDEVMPYYGAGMPLARDVAGYDFLYWELMRRGCEAGYRLFDYGRSKQGTGSWSFKKNWGFEPQPLYYEFQLHRGDKVPDNNPLNPKYQRAIRMWQRLPLSVANVLGPRIVRNLG
ncbi:FemAB family XrtA/PEP-CTERM system-associated protein [Aquisalimonas asiatica]|uniref:FemAB-related protein, PEP-CTERM system-associated n=1 Tax=Aquisalimonas asiatica TaxID=406100 RepID=A0A1H8U3E1_9GAMM|nr:FemAB family XrtA/PEP-CTERM system-associated protein [Aquisalimonas asiatica]SEO97749.1 FemAB-related protein, PEP-CTERM system-associated [Aquisalimonas asiatica]